MRKTAALALAPLLFLGACATSNEQPAGPPEMEIAVDFRDVHRCSRISPEITVAYAPEGTRFYDVRLVEMGDQERFMGGGHWREDGTGVIPEGALTRHYTGPCPPAGKSQQYAYVVTALETEGGQPLAVRLYRFTPE